MSRLVPMSPSLLRRLAGSSDLARERSVAGRGGIDRRDFLRAGGALAAFAALTRAPVARALGAVLPPTSLFTLGVASGDPTDTGVVLWTRLAPDPLAGGGMDPVPVTVKWEVATDMAMQHVVRSGEEIAVPEEAHTVHAEVTGLESDRWYWYRFLVGDEASPVARTRTFPDPRTLATRFRFGLASCQDYQSGFYSAYHDMSQSDLDCVIHVGDYIYEGGINQSAIRQHNSGEIFTLTDYRNRYALYKSDPWLQATHSLFPFLVTWDDHEVDNNYADDRQENGAPVDAFLARRAAAYRAYWEHMPLRRVQKPVGPDMKLYRSFSFGRLANVNVLDTRQYRTDQPCGDLLRIACPEVYAESATMVGADQERWLLKNLHGSRARWNVLAQQVMMMQMDFGQVFGAKNLFNMDAWDAYQASRRRILAWAGRYRVGNLVVLTGDFHASWAADLKLDFSRPESATVGTEFVGTSITSGFEGDLAPYIAAGLAANPHIKLFEGTKRGWVRFEVTPELWRGDFLTMTSLADPLAPSELLTSFVVESGVPGLQEA